MDTFKWSVRHMQLDAVEKLTEIQANSGELLGVLASEAIEYWYEHACEEAEDEASIATTEAADIHLLDVGQGIAHIRNDSASPPHEIKS